MLDIESLSYADSRDSSHSMAECVDEDDDWVIVKKQRINILVPPPSQPLPMSPKKSSIPIASRIVRRSSRKKRHGKLAKAKSKRSFPTPAADGNVKRSKYQESESNIVGPLKSGASADGNGISSRAQESNRNIVGPLKSGASADGNGISSRTQESDFNVVGLVKRLTANGTSNDGNGIRISSRGHQSVPKIVAPFKKLELPKSTRSFGKGRRVSIHRKARTFGSAQRSLPIGAPNVVNQRLRALNLERKLKALGGLRRWLTSQGLDRFINIFEREKMGKYQLTNLSMSKLKDMGADAVGPRRKLIHGIDSLCQPYYNKIL